MFEMFVIEVWFSLVESQEFLIVVEAGLFIVEEI